MVTDNEYSDEGFWDKVVSFAKAAGKEVIEKALWLYYAAQDPATPAWAKGIVYGALGYFIVRGRLQPARRALGPWCKPPASSRFLFQSAVSPPISNPPASSWW